MWIHEGKEYHKCNLHGETNPREVPGEEQMPLQAFIDLEKVYDRIPREVIY